MPTKGTTARAIRIPDDLWREALATAHNRGEDVSAVIRRALRDYVTAHQELGARAGVDDDTNQGN